MSEWSPKARVYDPLKAGSIDGTDLEPHDRAVWRAMNARYKSNKGVTGDPHLTLFVARLNPLTTEETLQEAFSAFGELRRVRLVRDHVTGCSKRYAFLEFKEERSVRRAWRDANHMVIEQQEIFVELEQQRTLPGWIPRRLGGGQGGKKESGQLRFGGRDRPFRKPFNISNAMWREEEDERFRRRRNDREEEPSRAGRERELHKERREDERRSDRGSYRKEERGSNRDYRKEERRNDRGDYRKEERGNDRDYRRAREEQRR
ncbi:hypothetical protein DNTS_032816 [Danionella cerebrum]|uniref:U11/U12 small nuclear ribonucleoprotein 35 kDa protein n=1 Tax=Danionella cerebrum TaxID=2873325 RepID=A0A553QVJ0_9TELE|nr:hypothetical protein DNTS_032816 [Danionella translucida]